MTGMHANPRWSRLAGLVSDNPLLLAVAVIGFAVSFETISALARAHHLPGWPVLYPVLIDVGILSMIVESRKAIEARRSDLAPRLLAWALIGLTLYVNAHGAAPHDWLGRALHVVGPALWAALLELTRWRKLARRRAAEGDRIPRSRWLLSPWRTCGMRRRMILHHVTSYPVACAREDARLAAISLMPAVWGPNWKRSAPALLRHHLAEGTLPAALADACSAAVPGAIPATGELAEEWVTSSKASTVRVTTRARQAEQVVAAAEAAPVPVSRPRQPGKRKPAVKAPADHAAVRAVIAANPGATNAVLGSLAGVSPRTVQRVKATPEDNELPVRSLRVAGSGG